MANLDRKLAVIIMLVFFLVIVMIGLTYSSSASMAPLAAGIIGLICMIPELLEELRSTDDGSASANQSQLRQREAVLLAWVVLLILLTLSVGLVPAAVLFAAAYARFAEGFSIKLSAAMAVGIGGFIYGMFDRLLQITLYQGWLARLWL